VNLQYYDALLPAFFFAGHFFAQKHNDNCASAISFLAAPPKTTAILHNLSMFVAKNVGLPEVSNPLQSVAGFNPIASVLLDHRHV